MRIAGSLEFAQVRIQSRFGARASASAWREIEHARELSRLIELARGAGFERLLARLPMPAGLHELDFAVREQWREQVDEVAGWMPPEWQAAVQWCALIVSLAFMQYLAAGGIPPGWMKGDETFAAMGAQPDPQALAGAWYRQWKSRMPRLSDENEAHFQGFERTVGSHLGAFSKAAADEGWRHRQLLEHQLSALFRRSTLEPLLAFVFLALQWLDLERLRGEIATRIAFASRSPVS